jgi:uncharacterized membrane protein YphA (DoxX/SURF4 family)
MGDHQRVSINFQFSRKNKGKKMNKIKKYIPWLFAIFVAGVVFIPSLFFKFAGAAETRHIFATVGEFLGISMFEPYGRYLIALVELTAAILLLIPRTQVYGSVVALGVLSGAILSHLVSPLGIIVRWVENGILQEDSTLFILAILSFISCLTIIWMRRVELPLKLIQTPFRPEKRDWGNSPYTRDKLSQEKA